MIWYFEYIDMVLDQCQTIYQVCGTESMRPSSVQGASTRGASTRGRIDRKSIGQLVTFSMKSISSDSRQNL